MRVCLCLASKVFFCLLSLPFIITGPFCGCVQVSLQSLCSCVAFCKWQELSSRARGGGSWCTLAISRHSWVSPAGHLLEHRYQAPDMAKTLC